MHVTPISMMNLQEKIKSTFLGVALGDALGVPVEFVSRDELKLNPVNSMKGNGTHNVPVGVWSDDSSLSFCLAESLINGYNLSDIASKMSNWYQKGYWTATGEVFDIGMTTLDAVIRLIDGASPHHSGDDNEWSNGNGALMRISPLIFFLYNSSLEEKSRIVKEVGAITHAHIRSVLSCYFFLEFGIALVSSGDKNSALIQARQYLEKSIRENDLNTRDKNEFQRILLADFTSTHEREILSGGYVIHTIEASLWCFLCTENPKEALLKAVNLGGDTDTVASITGALCGLYYDLQDFPTDWVNCIALKDEILDLADRFCASLNTLDQ